MDLSQQTLHYIPATISLLAIGLYSLCQEKVVMLLMNDAWAGVSEIVPGSRCLRQTCEGSGAQVPVLDQLADVGRDDTKKNRQDASCEDRPRKLVGRFSFRIRELKKIFLESFFPKFVSNQKKA
ncbi:hypothetical protein J6590_060563 [Homalodisca vitripennis]|nr:hypothetical protein J6590_060563 [Homalodisca vitripennis]